MIFRLLILHVSWCTYWSVLDALPEGDAETPWGRSADWESQHDVPRERHTRHSSNGAGARRQVSVRTARCGGAAGGLS